MEEICALYQKARQRPTSNSHWACAELGHCKGDGPRAFCTSGDLFCQVSQQRLVYLRCVVHCGEMKLAFVSWPYGGEKSQLSGNAQSFSGQHLCPHTDRPLSSKTGLKEMRLRWYHNSSDVSFPCSARDHSKCMYAAWWHQVMLFSVCLIHHVFGLLNILDAMSKATTLSKYLSLHLTFVQRATAWQIAVGEQTNCVTKINILVLFGFTFHIWKCFACFPVCLKSTQSHGILHTVKRKLSRFGYPPGFDRRNWQFNLKTVLQIDVSEIS